MGSEIFNLCLFVDLCFLAFVYFAVTYIVNKYKKRGGLNRLPKK